MPSLLLKRNTSTGVVPTAGALSVGELAINAADSLLYTKDSGGTIRKIGGMTAVFTGDVQTLTGKTLTSPAIGTNLVLNQTTANYTLTWSNPAAARAYNIQDNGAPTVGTNQFVVADVAATPATNDVIKWNGTKWISGPQAGGGGSLTIQDEGTNLTARTTLNFSGNGLVAADDSANARTTVTISDAGASTPGVVTTGVQTFAGAKTTTGLLTVSGGFVQKRTAPAAAAFPYTVLGTDYLLAVTDTTAARTINLPAASTFAAGQQLIISDESGTAGTNNITINRAGTDTIEGATSLVIKTNYAAYRIYSDGVSKWFTASGTPLADATTNGLVGTAAQTFAGNKTFVGGLGSQLGIITSQLANYNDSVTWNNSGVSFIGESLAVTDTASAATSMLTQYTVGGVLKFGVRKDGYTSVGYLDLAVQSVSPTTVDGDVWFESTASNRGLNFKGSGLVQNVVSSSFIGTAKKTVVNPTTAVTMVPTGIGTMTLPANFWYAGRTIRIDMGGYYSTGNTTTIVNWYLNFGAVQLGFATSNVAWGASIVNAAWVGYIYVTCFSVGTSGTFSTTGQVNGNTGISFLNNTTSANTTTLVVANTTAAALLDITFKVTTSNASHSFTMTNITVQAIS